MNTVKYQPENAIVLPPWTGDANDRELFKFVEFLECELVDSLLVLVFILGY